MAAAPVAALVAEADVAKAVINTAIVADVLTPVARVKAVAVMVIAPVAGGPESALVWSLHPRARHPVIAAWTPGPVSGRPEITVVGRRRLVVVGQRRRRLIRVGHRLSAVAGIVRALIRLLGIGAVWSTLPGAQNLCVGAVRDGGKVGRCRVRSLALRGRLVVIRRDRGRIRVASGGKQHYRQSKQRQTSKSRITHDFNLQSSWMLSEAKGAKQSTIDHLRDGVSAGRPAARIGRGYWLAGW